MNKGNGKRQIGWVGSWPLYIWLDESCTDNIRKAVLKKSVIEMILETAIADFSFENKHVGRLAQGAVVCVFGDADTDKLGMLTARIWEIVDYMKDPDDYVARLRQMDETGWIGIYGDERDIREFEMAKFLRDYETEFLM